MTAAPVLGPIGSLGEHATRYAAAGLEIFPARPDKTPYISQYKATSDIDQVAAWWREWPNALIGHRLPPDIIVLDIDPKSGGDATWRALRAAAGLAAVTTRAHLSGRGDGGGHTWWRRPSDKVTIARLDAWAEERGLGHAILNRDGSRARWTSGIDILQHDHRYTILPPSPHPDTGRPYRWPGDGRDITTPVLALPQLLVDLLADDHTPPPPRPVHDPDPDSIADWYSSTRRWADVLEPAGWTLVGGDGDSDGARWRHPTATSAFSATVRHDCLFVYSPNTPLEVTSPGSPHGYTRFRAWATLRHNGDQQAAARAARADKDGPPAERDDLSWVFGATTASAAADEPSEPPERPLLPDEFWEARPVLNHIRTAARSRMCAPDALFAATLARVCLHTDYRIMAPPIIGSHGTLNMFVSIVGASGAGKGAATSVAEELVAPGEQVGYRTREAPAGSGEGMVHAYFEKVTVTEGKKKSTVMKRAYEGLLIRCDEGQALAALAGRQGQTTMETLRQAFSGEALGGQYASDDKKVTLRAHDYRMAMLLAVQPVHARSLLDDWAGGTPQRFWWAGAIDPGAPELDDLPDWPGPIRWQPPIWNSGDHCTVRGYTRGVLDVDPSVVAEIRQHHRQVNTGTIEVGRYDGHRNYVRLKIACALAVLDERLDVSVEDWDLAGVVVATSDRVRASILAHIQAEQADLEAGRNARAARTAQAQQAAVRSYDDNVTRVARRIGDFVHRLVSEGHDGVARRDVHAALGKRNRQWMDAALAHAEALDWLRVDSGGRFRPGSGRPAQ